MCGIVGYLGKKSAVPLILDSLRTLEYRGYDSAGIAFLDDDNLFHIYKAAGKLVNLENVLSNRNASENKNHIGIGHIRWATHGPATEVNAHPHHGGQQEIALVHNGIIENYFEIKQELEAKGRTFVSETDTECIAQLLEQLTSEMPSETPEQFRTVIQATLNKLIGAYALSIINKKFPEHLFAIRNHAPLVIGKGENEYLVASDAVAIISHTQHLLFLKDKEIAEITPEGIRLTDIDGTPIEPIIEHVNLGPLQIDKKGFKHFMLKEIHEQPDVVRNSLSGRLISAECPIRLLPSEAEDSSLNHELNKTLKEINRIVVVGCGTSFNAGLVGKYFIEELVGIPVEVESAGEYRYKKPIINEKTLIIAISQSGETADTLEAVRRDAKLGAKILTITNREDSSLARESHIVFPVRAGVEVSVCATKSFTAQIIVFYLLGLAMAETRQTASDSTLRDLKTGLLKAPALIEASLSNPEPIQALAKQYGTASNILFIARGINFPVALEGALKLKEISYIHAEGYSGSELKHGPIAMLDESIPVISVLVPGLVFEKMISNCQEAKARDARIIGITSAVIEPKKAETTFDALLQIPKSLELLSPLITTIPLQLLAYYMAEYLGKDVDQPRNLAKSVTVE